MSRQYTLPTFLRQTPTHLLADYFTARGLLPDLDLEAIKKSKTARLISAIENLPGDHRARVEADFRDVHALADPAGTRILMDELELLGIDLVDQLSAMENCYARALWLLLNRHHNGQDLFETCLDIAAAHELKFTASRRLRELPSLTPAYHAEMLTKMGAALREIYRKEGRGHRCKVDHYERPNPTRHYYIAYPEDYSTSDLQYQGDDDLQRVNRRAAFQIAFIYQPDEGILELHAPGSTKSVKALQTVFCRLALGLDGPPGKGADRCYTLNGLKDKDFAFPTDPVDGIAGVEVLALRFTRIGEQPHKILAEPAQGSGVTVHEWIDRFLDRQQVPLALLSVSQAKIRVTWHPEEGKRAKTVTFTLSWPDSSTLKDEPAHLVIKGYLKRWKLAP